MLLILLFFPTKQHQQLGKKIMGSPLSLYDEEKGVAFEFVSIASVALTRS